MAPPPGLPAAFLEPVPNALREVVARYARTHGPFGSVEVARRFGLGEAAVAGPLTELQGEGRVFEGEFRPGGSGREWCGAEVLASLRRRSLAALRKQVEPVEPEALGRLLVDWQGVVTEGGLSPAGRGGPDALLDVIEQLQGAVVPASTLEHDVLLARLSGYRPEDLDAVTAAGEVVWVGMGPLGERDGRVSLFLTDALPLLLRPTAEPPGGPLHERLREHLSERGASFFGELLDAAGGGLARPVLDALWDLAWAGEITNDTPEALRAFLATRAPRSARRRRLGTFRSRRQVPPSAVGRWSRIPVSSRAPSSTARAKALAEQLLARHGVLTRDAAAFEQPPGGFSGIYPVLRALEEAGRIRRGYFVAGRGGLQFAHPGALERLRARRDADPGEPQAIVLSAADPANPYGAAIPWPKTDGTRLQRAAGAHVVLVDGALGVYVAGNGRDVVPLLPREEPARTAVARAAARALARWGQATSRPALGWVTGAGPPLAEGPLAPFLVEAGFVRSGPGFRLAGAAAGSDGV
jgi:ATP-dependent Lhr-like helicase